MTDWVVIALNATAVPPNSILQSRALAIIHGAIYDAVRAVDRKSSAYAVDVEAPAEPGAGRGCRRRSREPVAARARPSGPCWTRP